MTPLLDALHQATPDLLSGDLERVAAAQAAIRDAVRAAAAGPGAAPRRAELRRAIRWIRALAATAMRGAAIAAAERTALTGGRTGPAAILSGRA